MAKKEALEVGAKVIHTVLGVAKPCEVTLVHKDGTVDVRALEENSWYASVDPAVLEPKE